MPAWPAPTRSSANAMSSRSWAVSAGIGSTIQAQILDLLRTLAIERHTAVVLITHDMGVVADIADRVAVMYAGRIAETGPVDAIFAAPRHPYTALLLASIPRLSDIPK